ncbi:hypothetical protein [Aquibacillus sediminis]|nr:hypothetical protein [Aquibacillus sediminis]
MAENKEHWLDRKEQQMKTSIIISMREKGYSDENISVFLEEWGFSPEF